MMRLFSVCWSLLAPAWDLLRVLAIRSFVFRPASPVTPHFSSPLFNLQFMFTFINIYSFITFHGCNFMWAWSGMSDEAHTMQVRKVFAQVVFPCHHKQHKAKVNLTQHQCYLFLDLICDGIIKGRRKLYHWMPDARYLRNKTMQHTDTTLTLMISEYQPRMKCVIPFKPQQFDSNCISYMYS